MEYDQRLSAILIFQIVFRFSIQKKKKLSSFKIEYRERYLGILLCLMNIFRIRLELKVFYPNTCYGVNIVQNAYLLSME